MAVQYNPQKFLQALLALDNAPVASDTKFADYMSSFAFAPPSKMDTQALVSSNEHDRSALNEVFDWLSAPLYTVTNTIEDVAKGNLGGALQDIGGGIANIVQPATEILSVPGVKTPWEGLANKTGEVAEKFNTSYHGEGPAGFHRLREAVGLDTGNKWGNAAIDLAGNILLDPLTYATFGTSALTKAKGAAEGAAKTLEEAAATGAPLRTTIESTNKVPEAFAGINPMQKPTVPNLSQSAIRRFSLPNVTPKFNIRGEPWETLKVSPIEQAAHDFRLHGLTPEAERTARAIQMADKRWYEKLHPIEVPPTRISKAENPAYNLGKTLENESGILKPTELTREDVVDAVQHIATANRPDVLAILKNPTQFKQLVRGIEDSLVEKGHTLPEGNLSDFLHSLGKKHSKVEDFDAYAYGKPLKARPAEEAAVIGPDFFEKAFKDNPYKLMTTKGPNPLVVESLIKDIGEGVAPRTMPKIEPVADAGFKFDAEKIANGKVQSSWGKTLNRHKELTPANQANLYNSIYQSVIKKLESHPSLLPFKGKGGILAKRNQAFARSTALQSTVAAFDYLERAHGIHAVDWAGNKIRMTDVIAELGTDALEDYIPRVIDAFARSDISKLTDPVAVSAYERAMARRATETGTLAKTILDHYVSKNKFVDEAYSYNAAMAEKRLQNYKAAKRDALMNGASAAEANHIAELAKNYVDPEKVDFLTPFGVVDALGSGLVEVLQNGGKVTPTVASKMKRAINKAMGEDIAKADYVRGNLEKITDGMMLRYATWYGKGEMFKFAQDSYAAIEQIAKHRAKWFNDKYKRFSPEDQVAAFRIAQGYLEGMAKTSGLSAITDLGTPAQRELAGYIRDYFENIVGSSSTLGRLTESPGSVAVRSGMTMGDLDRQLKAIGSNFQFKNYVKTNKVGDVTGDYKVSWLRAWENADPSVIGQDPLRFLHDLDLAAERVAAEYNLVDDFVARFGKTVGSPEYNKLVHTHGAKSATGVAQRRIPENVRFTKEQWTEFNNLLKHVEEGPWMPESAAGRFYFKMLRHWKSGVTVYSPAHHTRNLIGDTWLMWAAGHNDPRAFGWAWKMMSSNRAVYKDAIQSPTLEALQGLVSKTDYLASQSKLTDIILHKHGANLTSHELYNEAFQRGLLLDATRIEDLGAPLFHSMANPDASAMSRFLRQPLGGRAHNFVGGVSEVREHYVRLAHFTSAVNKAVTPAVAKRLKAAEGNLAKRSEIMNDIYTKATHEVRKWHPDGRDLTHFEQKFMRGLFPFYSWQRKAIPLLFLTMAQKPAKITAYPKTAVALQEALGIGDGPMNMSDPYPEDQLFASWTLNGGIGPIGDPSSQNAIAAWFGKLGRNYIDPITGGEEGYTLINPGNPFNDTIRDFGRTGSSPLDLIQGLAGMVTPAGAIPAEIAFDQKLGTGVPISQGAGGEGYLPWAAETVPIASMLERLGEFGKERSEGVESGFNSQPLLNLLTGAGILGTGAYQKSAEFEEKEKAKKQKKEASK